MPSKSRSSPAPADAGEVTFEQALAELEEITHALDGEGRGLDDLVAKYERGMGLLGICQRQLDAAQLRIEQISLRADGGVESVPFNPSTAGASRSPAPASATLSPAPVETPSDDDEIRLF